MSNLTPRQDRDYKNIIRNGNFDFWQRGASISGIASSARVFVADRFSVNRGGGNVLTYEQITDTATNASQIAARVRVTTAHTTPNSRFVQMNYVVEGYDLAEMIGRKLYLQFLVRSSVAGFYSFSILDGGQPTRYRQDFEIEQANTWELKQIVIDNVPDVPGWEVGSGAGMRMIFSPAQGSDFNTPAPLGTWDPTHNTSSPNVSANTWGNTIGDTFDIDRVYLTTVEDSFTIDRVGTDGIPFQRHGINITAEQFACQRYYQKTGSVNAGNTPGVNNYNTFRYHFDNANTAGRRSVRLNLKSPMRAAPTVRIWDSNHNQGSLALIVSSGGSLNNEITGVGFSADEDTYSVSYDGAVAHMGFAAGLDFDADFY